jgi:hypothetical protein
MAVTDGIGPSALATTGGRLVSGLRDDAELAAHLQHTEGAGGPERSMQDRVSSATEPLAAAE